MGDCLQTAAAFGEIFVNLVPYDAQTLRAVAALRITYLGALHVVLPVNVVGLACMLTGLPSHKGWHRMNNQLPFR